MRVGDRVMIKPVSSVHVDLHGAKGTVKEVKGKHWEPVYLVELDEVVETAISKMKYLHVKKTQVEVIAWKG